MSFIPSVYQSNIFNFVKTGSGHGQIVAVAGSGKTTTLLESLKLTIGKVIFLAFNKAIASELQRRSPSNVECSTLHSAGYAMLRNSIKGKIQVSVYKIDNIMDGYNPLMRSPSIKGKEAMALYSDRAVVKRMASYIKAGMLDYTDGELMAETSQYYGVDDYEPRHLPMIKYVIEKSNSQINIIDFDDMIYLPVLLKLRSKVAYNWVFVDECQDLNRSQIDLVLSLISGTGRVIAVGDPAQSIYGFRGADCGAMERIRDALNATVFPLSVCYRCPKKVIELAKDLVPAIESREGAPEGIIAEINKENFLDKIETEDMAKVIILSRTNAELVGNALRLIARGKKAVIKGRDIGQGLISLVKKMNAKSIGELEIALSDWQTKELEKLSKRRNSESAMALVQDKFEVLSIIIRDCDSPYCVTNKLESLFSDEAIIGYTFSSVHRAKGLEADTIYILAPHKLPLYWRGQQAWETEQENNIRYVAITRSLNKLVWVNG